MSENWLKACDNVFYLSRSRHDQKFVACRRKFDGSDDVTLARTKRSKRFEARVHARKVPQLDLVINRAIKKEKML